MLSLTFYLFTCSQIAKYHTFKQVLRRRVAAARVFARGWPPPRRRPPPPPPPHAHPEPNATSDDDIAQPSPNPDVRPHGDEGEGPGDEPAFVTDWERAARDIRSLNEEEEHKRRLDRLKQANDPVAAKVAAFATHHRLSQSCLDDLIRVIFPLLPQNDSSILADLAKEGRSMSSIELWARSHGISPASFAPKIHNMKTRSEVTVEVPTWSLKKWLTDFLGDELASCGIMVRCLYNGNIFGHFTTGTVYRDIHHDCCARGEIPICIEISVDDTDLTDNFSFAPVFLSISNQHPSLKGLNRFVLPFASHPSELFC